MTKEDKELLFKDLCSRFPYGVIVETQLVNSPRAKYPVLKVLQSHMLCDFMQTVENVIHKPYLRPMTSMTEEERKEYELLANRCISTSVGFIHFEVQELIDWLNKNMFDYRGLIPKDLAIEVTEENNPYKY